MPSELDKTKSMMSENPYESPHADIVGTNETRWSRRDVIRVIAYSVVSLLATFTILVEIIKRVQAAR